MPALFPDGKGPTPWQLLWLLGVACVIVLFAAGVATAIYCITGQPWPTVFGAALTGLLAATGAVWALMRHGQIR